MGTAAARLPPAPNARGEQRHPSPGRPPLPRARGAPRSPHPARSDRARAPPGPARSRNFCPTWSVWREGRIKYPAPSPPPRPRCLQITRAARSPRAAAPAEATSPEPPREAPRPPRLPPAAAVKLPWPRGGKRHRPPQSRRPSPQPGLVTWVRQSGDEYMPSRAGAADRSGAKVTESFRRLELLVRSPPAPSPEPPAAPGGAEGAGRGARRGRPGGRGGRGDPARREPRGGRGGAGGRQRAAPRPREGGREGERRRKGRKQPAAK